MSSFWNVKLILIRLCTMVLTQYEIVGAYNNYVRNRQYIRMLLGTVRRGLTGLCAKKIKFDSNSAWRWGVDACDRL